MAKPDLDEGYLRIAHELFAAIAVAGFNKWEMVVLREVFDQVYGPKKSRTARLSPTDVATRAGTYKESIVRAIRTLAAAGVLAKTAEGEYRFIKDYESWRHGDKPRYSASELAYCRAAKRIKASNEDGNNGAPRPGTDSFPVGNRCAPPGEQIRSPSGTDSFPVGNRFVPREAVPPRPPIEERVRDKKREERGEGGERPRDPIAEQCIEIATRRWGASNGDRIIGDFLKEYPAGWVRRAMDEMFDALKGDFRPKYLRSILQRFQQEGGPKDRNGFASHRRPEPEIKFHRKGDPL